MPKRSRVAAAERTFPRAPLTLGFGVVSLALAASLGPAKLHLSWHTPAIQIPPVIDFDQLLAQRYFLLPSAPLGSDAAPLTDPALVPAAAHETAGQTAGDAPPDEAPVEQLIEVQKGDTLMSVLTDAGISSNEAHAAVAALSDVFSPRALKPGQPIKLTLAPNDQEDAGDPSIPALQLVGLTLQPSAERNVELTRGFDGTFTAKSKDVPLDLEETRAAGTIRSSLFEAGHADGVPIQILTDVIHAFSYDVDFQRDFQPGDRYEILYEGYLDAEGNLAKTGSVVFASPSAGES